LASAATGVIRTIPVGSYPDGVSSDGTHVWVANATEDTVSEIEASSGTVIRTIPVGSYPTGVSSDGTHVWVTNEDNTVSEIEASSGTVIRTIPVGHEPNGVSSDGTRVWVTNLTEATASEIEASSGTVIRTIPVDYEPNGVSSDGTDVWVTMAYKRVSEIEASSGTVIHTILVGNYPNGVSSDGTDVWVTNYHEGTVSEILVNGPAPVCTASSGTVTLSPGLTDTAAVQTMKIKGTLTGCTDASFTKRWFTGATYKATLKTTGPVSCSVLTGTGEPATEAAAYKWTPKAKTSTGTLTMPLTETPDIAFSGEVTIGPYSPLTLTGTITESYTGGAACGEKVRNKAAKAVKKGTFSGSAVSFEFE
jgi:YVTN family beta-propeller protein